MWVTTSSTVWLAWRGTSKAWKRALGAAAPDATPQRRQLPCRASPPARAAARKSVSHTTSITGFKPMSTSDLQRGLHADRGDRGDEAPARDRVARARSPAAGSSRRCSTTTSSANTTANHGSTGAACAAFAAAHVERQRRSRGTPAAASPRAGASRWSRCRRSPARRCSPRPRPAPRRGSCRRGRCPRARWSRPSAATAIG